MNLVYYSNYTRNTERFVLKLGMDAIRIEDGIPPSSVLITPTYGNAAVPKPVIRALNNGPRQNIVAVIATGNMNFGQNFCAAGLILSRKLEVPLLYKLELAGTDVDVSTTIELLKGVQSVSFEHGKSVPLGV